MVLVFSFQVSRLEVLRVLFFFFFFFGNGGLALEP